MSKQSEKEDIELQISRIRSFVDDIERIIPSIRKLTSGSAELDSLLKTQLMAYASKINFSKVNPDAMKEWEDHLYFLFQEKGMKEYEWKIAVPKWADSIHFGMLVGEAPGHRIFLVSRYIDMVYDLPDWLREKIGESHIIFDPEQYTRYHKRLFGVMDRGFKIVLHREGISDKIIHNREPIEREHIPREKAVPRQARQSRKEEVIMETNHPILSLLGIQIKLQELNNGERKVINLLFQRESQEFSVEGLAALLGYKDGNQLNHNISFKKMMNMKLITKSGKGTYKADLSLMALIKK